MCTDLCQCICVLYQQTLPAEVLSACSCTLLNKVWTLTSGVQLPSQNEAPLDQIFSHSNHADAAVKQHQTTLQASSYYALALWSVCADCWRGSCEKMAYISYSLIPSTPYFIICLTGIRVVLERGSVAKATACWRDWERGDEWGGKRERGRQAIKNSKREIEIREEKLWTTTCESEREGRNKTVLPVWVCVWERDEAKSRESRADRGRKEKEPCSHYSSWVTSHHSHNSRSWHVTSTIIWSKFTQPGWHAREGEGVGQW